jgi:hypothetical protein
LKLLIVTTIYSCGKLPVKPSIDSCIIIVDEAFCVNNITLEEYYLPIEKMHKYTCESNEDRGKLLTYIRLLENAAPKRIRKKLNFNTKGFYKANEKLNGF